MDKRSELEATVRAWRIRYKDVVQVEMSRSIIRQVKENWDIARDTLRRYDLKESERDSIVYTAQGNRAQKFRPGL